MVGWMWIYYKLHEAIEVTFVCSLFLTGVYLLSTDWICFGVVVVS